MRPLRDRLAELLRRARLGMAGGRWVEQTDVTKAEWRASADQFLALARDFDIEIEDRDR